MCSIIESNILIVEDEAVLAMVEKRDLEKRGYCVNFVCTGEKAVQTILESTVPVDLILMDIDLGSGQDGIQCAEEILKFKDIPIIFLSSHTEPEIVEKIEKISSYGYVVKDSGIIILDASIKMAFRLFEAKAHSNKIYKKLISTMENLQTHQLELQVQNEELQEKHAELESLRSKYMELYDKAPVGYFTLNDAGQIIEVNLPGSELIGVSRSLLFKQQFASFIHSEDHDTFHIYTRNLVDSDIAQSCLLHVKRNDGVIFLAYIVAVRAFDHNNSSLFRIIMIESNSNAPYLNEQGAINEQ